MSEDNDSLERLSPITVVQNARAFEITRLRARVAEWQAVYEKCDKSRDELVDKLCAALTRVAELEGELEAVQRIADRR